MIDTDRAMDIGIDMDLDIDADVHIDMHADLHVYDLCISIRKLTEGRFKQCQTSIRLQEKHEVVRQSEDAQRRLRQVHRQKHACY